MSNTVGSRYRDEFVRKLYPAFSRRATQVCILCIALEQIANGNSDAKAVALAALDQADAFDWKGRSAIAKANGSTP